MLSVWPVGIPHTCPWTGQQPPTIDNLFAQYEAVSNRLSEPWLSTILHYVAARQEIVRWCCRCWGANCQLHAAAEPCVETAWRIEATRENHEKSVSSVELRAHKNYTWRAWSLVIGPWPSRFLISSFGAPALLVVIVPRALAGRAESEKGFK